MATREHRLSSFNCGPAPEGKPVVLLCEDHAGTYLLPYDCQWKDGAWRGYENENALEAKVVGWRERTVRAPN
jgi:hypothetical protein